MEIRHNIVLAIAAALTITAGKPAPAADAAKTPAEVIRAAIVAYRADDCMKANSLIAPLLKAGQSVEGRDQALAYDVAISCALAAKDMVSAGDYARRATELPDGSDFAWRIRVAADAEAKRYGAVIDTFERMMQGHGGALNAIPPLWLLQIRADLVRTGDDANETRLLRIMADPAYDPNDVAAKIRGTADQARAWYARKLLKAGQRDAARAQIDGLAGFGALSEVALDPALLALRGTPIDLRAAVENDLARHRAMIVQYPRALEAINAVSTDLYRLGRNDEAITLLKSTLPNIDQNGFDDRAEELPWFWNSLANAYGATGQYDAMVAAYAKGAALPERGLISNISQTINLAENQFQFGHAKEALVTLAQLDEKSGFSPYGLMQVRIVRGCARAVLGQLDKARSDLDYAIANPNDDPAAIASLKLCVGDENGAAASFIARLGDPDTRRIAMLDLADYDAPDPRKPVGPFDAARERLRKRPDIVAAIRAAGGPLRIHLQRDPF